MRRRPFLALLTAAILAACAHAPHLGAARSAAPSAGVREAFNADAGKTRVLILGDPT